MEPWKEDLLNKLDIESEELLNTAKKQAVKRVALICSAAAITLASLFAFSEPAREWGAGMRGLKPEITEPLPAPVVIIASPAAPSPPGYTYIPIFQFQYFGRPATEHFTIEYADREPTIDEWRASILFETEYFIYHLPPMHYILFGDGTRLPLTEALNSRRVTIEDCIANGLWLWISLKPEHTPWPEDNLNFWGGYLYKFHINGVPFVPSIHFMLAGDGIGLKYRSNELFDMLIQEGHEDAARRLLEYSVMLNTPNIAKSPYYSAEELAKAGIGVYIDQGRFSSEVYFSIIEPQPP
jgi:hypothetical protein